MTSSVTSCTEVHKWRHLKYFGVKKAKLGLYLRTLPEILNGLTKKMENPNEKGVNEF